MLQTHRNQNEQPSQGSVRRGRRREPDPASGEGHAEVPIRFGFLILRADGDLRFASRGARELLGDGEGPAGLEARIVGLRPHLRPITKESSRDSFPLPWGAGEPGRAPLCLAAYPIGESECEGFLVLVSEQAVARSPEIDRRDAEHLRVLSQLYPVAIHDLRAPLHTSVLNLELLAVALEEIKDPDLVARLQRYSQAIGSEISRFDATLSALVKHVRLSAEVDEPLDLRGAIVDLQSLVAPYARRKRVQVHWQPLPELPVRIQGSREALQPALLSLVFNAVEARNGGQWELSVLERGPEALLVLVDAENGTLPDVSFARALVEGIGGQIRVHPGSPRGVRIEAAFPLANRGR